MRKLKRGVVWGFWITGILGAGMIVFYYTPKAPVAAVRMAREALRQAQEGEAEKYAREVYAEACQSYDSAMHCWARENERFFLFRNYSKVDAWIAHTIDNAISAKQLSCDRAKSANSRVKGGVVELEKQVAVYDRYFKRMPLPASVSKAHNKGVLKLSEARFAWQNKRFAEADKHFREAEELISGSNEKAEKLVRNWFNSHGQWQRQAQRAVQMSGGGKRVILVDKLAHRCLVYQSGKPIRNFEVELGINWMGDKQRNGDKATPEGSYRITQKKDGSRTKFHKALLLNYPNDDDRSRFVKAKHNGSLPAKADIGGLIEVHGLGGKGVDWTDGCVALKNEDIDVLYRLVAVGTPVIIVGSLKPLGEILKNE